MARGQTKTEHGKPLIATGLSGSAGPGLCGARRDRRMSSAFRIVGASVMSAASLIYITYVKFVVQSSSLFA